MDLYLKDKVVLITGRAAESDWPLAAEGCRVMLLARSEAALAIAEFGLRALDQRAQYSGRWVGAALSAARPLAFLIR